MAVRTRQGLDLFARDEISSLLGYQAQIATGSIRKGEYIFSQGLVDSDRYQLSSLGRISLISRVGRVRQGLDVFAREQISSLEGKRVGQVLDFFAMKYISYFQRFILFWDTRVGQGLDLFAWQEIFSPKGRQSQIGTSSLHQGGDLLSLRPEQSDRDQITLLCM